MTRRHAFSGVPWEDEYGYARAVRVGDRILVAGTTATGPDGPVAPGDIAGQTRFIIGKIRTALEELGGSLQDVVRTRIYVSPGADWEAAARVHGEAFKDIRPANALLMAGLIGDFLVEMEAEAVVGAGSGSGPEA